jgi:transcriptional regulator with XRE-family HTH domain
MSSKLLNPLKSIDAELAARLQNDDAFRRRYIRFWAQTEVAAEILSLRRARGLRQVEVARLARTGQSAISRIEKADYDGWTFKTLIGIAEVLRARLRITFEPIEDVVGGYRTSTIPKAPVVLDDIGTTTDDADVDFRDGTTAIPLDDGTTGDTVRMM